jgi:hypothetical protein
MENRMVSKKIKQNGAFIPFKISTIPYYYPASLFLHAVKKMAPETFYYSTNVFMALSLQQVEIEARKNKRQVKKTKPKTRFLSRAYVMYRVWCCVIL